MPFEKGWKGGPGRPKQKPFLDWCKVWTVEKAEKYLVPIAQKASAKNQLEAIKLILAYGIGKPQESMNIDAEVAPRTGCSVEEATQLADNLLGPEAPGNNGVDGANPLDGGK